MVNQIMKIVGINASPKGDKSQTRRLVMGVLEGARQAGADITFIDLCSLDIAYCTACGTCYAKGECVSDDDYPMLLEKMMDADGIVLGSPNYINAVTAQMKTMLDRMADVVHCQALSGKYGCAVCTAGGSYADEVADYLRVEKKTIYEYVDDGTLEAVRIKGKRLIRIKRETVLRVLIPITE